MLLNNLKCIPIVALFVFITEAQAQPWQQENLGLLTPGTTKAVNALWGENPADVRFTTTKCVVVANLKGPAEITMMHFAYPQHHYSDAVSINRDLLLRIYWDDETNPSVECPFVDFFCDPDGTRDVVNTALVNVRRGFNCYFPMTFRKSARVELLYDGPVGPGDELASMMPCYSYVCYRSLKSIPRNMGYFCASWRQEALKLGLKEYVALEAQGKGKLVGWNVTVRQPGRHTYPVDENEKFYIDGEKDASVEFQGLEDSFGFSWGFPATENMFPLTGWFPFFNGAAAYRFFLQDCISFEKSLKVAIGFGKTEGGWRRAYSKFGTSVQFSSTVYWYQTEPHAPLPPMPPPDEREPAPEKLFWPEQAKIPSESDFKARGVKLALFCGDPDGETIYDQPGYSISWDPNAHEWDDWDGEVIFCRFNAKGVGFQLNLPAHVSGILRLYIIDADNFEGGRKETVVLSGKTAGTYEHFQNGRWIEVPVSSDDTAAGKLDVRINNARDGANAVVSKIEWTEKK